MFHGQCFTCVALSNSSRATVLVMPSHTMRDSTVLRAKLESTLRGLRRRRREHHKQFNDLNQALLSRLTGRKLINCKELHILHASIHNELQWAQSLTEEILQVQADLQPNSAAGHEPALTKKANHSRTAQLRVSWSTKVCSAHGAAAVARSNLRRTTLQVGPHPT